MSLIPTTIKNSFIQLNPPVGGGHCHAPKVCLPVVSTTDLSFQLTFIATGADADYMMQITPGAGEASFLGTISVAGSQVILTITSGGAGVSVGQIISGLGIAPGTYITALGNNADTYILNQGQPVLIPTIINSNAGILGKMGAVAVACEEAPPVVVPEAGFDWIATAAAPTGNANEWAVYFQPGGATTATWQAIEPGTGFKIYFYYLKYEYDTVNQVWAFTMAVPAPNSLLANLSNVIKYGMPVYVAGVNLGQLYGEETGTGNTPGGIGYYAFGTSVAWPAQAVYLPGIILLAQAEVGFIPVLNVLSLCMQLSTYTCFTKVPDACDAYPTSVLQYANNSDAFGFYYDGIQQLMDNINFLNSVRLPIYLHSPEQAEDQMSYEKSDGSTLKLSHRIWTDYKLKTDYLTADMHRALVAATAHDLVFITCLTAGLNPWVDDNGNATPYQLNGTPTQLVRTEKIEVEWQEENIPRFKLGQAKGTLRLALAESNVNANCG